jgi:phosphoglycolate phosphatase-like HAD superfamily hydrolase
LSATRLEAVLREKFISTFKLIFWDFDGVIKDSVEVKSLAFMQLFRSHGGDIAERVRVHHEAHGGMSRFDKIPRYLAWAGVTATPEIVEEYCQRFASLVRQGVIDAPWVPGVKEFLFSNPYEQEFVLVTATPQGEIEGVLAALSLRACFTDVYGAPATKMAAISEALVTRQLDPQHCLMIGDARADWDAARANRVPFLLRRHATNRRVFEHYAGDSIEDFSGLSFPRKEC